MTAPKSQHVIPRLHLQHFAGSDPKGQIWTYDAIAGKQWSSIPEETCVQSYFYSAERDDGSMDPRLEQFLAEVEGHAAPVYKNLLQGKFTNAQARIYFAQFIALLHTRTTAMRRLAGEIRGKGAQIYSYAYASNPDAFETLTRKVEAEKGEKMDPVIKERIRQAMLDPSRFKMEVSKESTFMALAGSDKLTPLLDKMKWTLVEALHGYFITSDNPVVRMVDPQTQHSIYGDHGFLNKTVEVTFPLSPRVLLLLSWNESARDHGALDRDHVHRLNEIRAAHSERFLFAHIQDSRISEMASRYRDSRPGVNIEGFGPKKFASINVARR